MTLNQARIAVLVPCFNEEAAIGKVVADFRNALPQAVVYVYDNTTHQVSTILSQTLRSSGQSNVHPFAINTPAANFACVYFVTSRGELGEKGSVVLDTAPDTGCPTTLDTELFNTLAAGGSPGGQGYF